MIKIDRGLQELEAVHSAKDGGEKSSGSAGTATGQYSEVQSSVQRLQGEVQELQEIMNNFEAEIQRITQGGDSKTERLQMEVEGLRDKVRLHSEQQSQRSPYRPLGIG